MPASKFASLAPLLLLFACCLSGQQGKAPQDASAVLQEMEKALISLDRVSYHYRRELNYASEGYHNVLEGDITIEFDPAQQPIGATYQAHNDAGFDLFNGSEIVSARTATHTLQISPIRDFEALDHVSFLYNSMLTLRRGLPGLLSNSAIVKTVTLQTATTTVVELRISGAVLFGTGSLSPATAARDNIYTITIDRATKLPIEVRQTNTQNSDFMLVRFAQVNTKPAKLPAGSWFYSSYPDYHLVGPGTGKKLAAVGSSAPEWTLPIAGEQGKTSSLAGALANSQTNLVLLEFWISFCGHSIDAVPKLNTIADRFSRSGLSILAINTDDNDRTIQLFVRNNAPRYTLLEDGQKAEDAYGVSTLWNVDTMLLGPQRTLARVLATLAAILALLALSLAGIGIYGVMAYVVSQRTQEIGVRIALGATPGRILKHIALEGLRPVLIGMVVGLAGGAGISLLLHRTLAFPGSIDFLYGVSFYDPFTFLAITIFLAGVSLIASLGPALKAIKVDPLVALRYE